MFEDDPELSELLEKYKDSPSVIAQLLLEKIHSMQHKIGLVTKDSCLICIKGW